MHDVNLVLINRIGKVATPSKGEQMTVDDFAAWVKELATMGYAASADLQNAVALNKSAANQILETLRVHARAHVSYNPLHGNFPAVMQTSDDLEIYAKAILHYFSAAFGATISQYASVEDAVKTVRKQGALAELGTASKAEARELLETIIVQGQPFSEADLDHVIALYDVFDASRITHLDVPIRENIAHLANYDSLWDSKLSTLTDVLRLAVALSGGHPSLSDDVKFRLSRPNRRRVADAMDRVLVSKNEDHEDLSRHPVLWKKLARSAHLGDYGHAAVNRALTAIYTESAESFNSRVEAAKLTGPVEASRVLVERPGVFARQLMELVRAANVFSRRAVLDNFKSVAQQVSLRVLIQLFDYVRGPKVHELENYPVYGKTSITGTLVNKRNDDYSDVIEALREGFKDRLGDREFNVDLDFAGQYSIPMGVRTATAASKLIGRGSRIKLDDNAEFVRLFMHWKNMESGYRRVDLDLSAVFVNEDFTETRAIWYGGLRSEDRRSYHSGDIVDAPNGAAEFIDVPLEVVDGFRYVALTVNSFTGQKLSSVPEAWAGVMERSGLNSGEDFEPADVVIRGDMLTDGYMTLPLVVDLKTREVIWVDRPIHSERIASNVMNSRPGTALQAAILEPRMSVQELLVLTNAELSEDGEELDPTRSEQILGLLD